MALAWDPVALAPLAAFVASASFAAIVLGTNPARVVNRRLALVLALEALYAGTQATLLLLDMGQETLPRWLNGYGAANFIALSVSYVFFLALLDTPLATPFRTRAARWSLLAFLGLMSASGFVWGTPAGADDDHIMVVVNGVVGSFAFVAISIYGIVVTISAFRRARRGTQLRKQAGALVAAFVLRDVIWIVSITGGIAISDLNAVASENFWIVGPAIAVLVYVPLLAYGILRTQLFDIDLKIKIGIRRGTVVGIILIAVFVAAKVVEVYLNRTVGVIAGSIVAGSLLFLVPKLNKIGEKVASTALPKVENTSAYVEFRKLEVYKAAIESALEGGELTQKERETIARLRVKLGIAEPDAAALENDVRERLDLPIQVA